MRAATDPVAGIAGRQDPPRLPVRALDRPRDDVLEAAERGHALALGLRGAEALVAAHIDAAPAAPRAARHRTRKPIRGTGRPRAIVRRDGRPAAHRRPR